MSNRRRASSRRVAACLLAATLLGTACGDPGTAAPRQPAAPNEGVQLSGRIGGAQLSVSHGDPDFKVADCDVDDGLDSDWCLVARSIDGARVEVIFENPIAFVPGVDLDVDFDRCKSCDDVTTGAIVDVVVDGDRRRASGGTIGVAETGPRWIMTLSLRFDDGGRINGEMNVRPQGAIVPADTASE